MNTVWKTTNRAKWQLTTVLTITPEKEREGERQNENNVTIMSHLVAVVHSSLCLNRIVEILTKAIGICCTDIH